MDFSTTTAKTLNTTTEISKITITSESPPTKTHLSIMKNEHYHFLLTQQLFNE
ncbi:hypothetical protein DPMN_102796 [Dreissena polymorpha]|uniref:Uncharacterized protein n=1 Tax=Dreissena polymorpha TaxID=45954 RepID=A0A9D4LL15_DREPO|nr:hypothetical protein DPMN_102796 [Dreissena polymorpha]